MSATSVQLLTELAEGWHVQISTESPGDRAGWSVAITRRAGAGSGRTFVYRDTSLERAIARAWAGEPTSDSDGVQS